MSSIRKGKRKISLEEFKSREGCDSYSHVKKATKKKSKTKRKKTNRSRISTFMEGNPSYVIGGREHNDWHNQESQTQSSVSETQTIHFSVNRLDKDDSSDDEVVFVKTINRKVDQGKLCRESKTNDSNDMPKEDEVVLHKEMSVGDIVKKRIRDAEQNGNVIVL